MPRQQSITQISGLGCLSNVKSERAHAGKFHFFKKKKICEAQRQVSQTYVCKPHGMFLQSMPDTEFVLQLTLWFTHVSVKKKTWNFSDYSVVYVFRQAQI